MDNSVRRTTIGSQPKDRQPDRIAPNLPHLSDRQLEIARLAAAGKSNREIAEDLFISVETVKSHLKQVFRLTGIVRRSQIILWLAHPEEFGKPGSGVK